MIFVNALSQQKRLAIDVIDRVTKSIVGVDLSLVDLVRELVHDHM